MNNLPRPAGSADTRSFSCTASKARHTWCSVAWPRGSQLNLRGPLFQLHFLINKSYDLQHYPKWY
ncbi:hypothetical protein E2C01_013069 [Portunus trituberculatus]|uniref:Uncharacterized protein n=1 Tax=Portunus trituberculatus TaxID=210409 RepID=A0A5B7DG45_PORTR|nr:hypothetical protein [Portunus trituberculatus]